MDETIKIKRNTAASKMINQSGETRGCIGTRDLMFRVESLPVDRSGVFSFAFTGLTSTGKETSAMGRNSLC